MPAAPIGTRYVRSTQLPRPCLLPRCHRTPGTPWRPVTSHKRRLACRACSQGPKQRKSVDRRASKGRKLRYHVHEKLVNFVAPVELQPTQFASQLLTNLFGGGGLRQ